MYIDTTNDEAGRIVLNAAHADTASAAEKLTVSDVGTSKRPVYFSGGVPVQTGTSLSVSVTGNAATATKLKTVRKIGLTDADGTNVGTGADFDGSAAITLKLPAAIKANLTGNVTGKADSADKLTTNAGSSSKPVYFSGGVPVACTSLNLNTTGSAAKWTTKQNFNIASSDGSGTSSVVAVDGSAAVTLKLPTTIKATLNGNAATATNAAAADKLNTDAGSTTVPVFFDGGIPTACSSLTLNTTGSAAKWTTARKFTISDGTNSGTATSVDGSDAVTLNLPTTIKADLTGNADTATNASAADKLNSNAGDKDTPIYFSGGVPVKCTGLDLDTSGNAATATKLKTARAISISDADGTNTAAGTNFDGNANITVKLPTTIKASLTGKATSAGTADKLASNAGNSNTPVYFSGGIPTACTSLGLDTTGNAATATQWATARTIDITDADGTNTGTAITIDGTEDTTLKLPATIKANLTGNATSADKLNSNAGSATVPVYFDGGIPNACTNLSLNTTGSAATLTNARNLTIMDYSLTYEGGKQSFDGSADVILEMPSEFEGTLHGNADSATKLTTATAGDSNTPVYFTGGKPVACTSLDLNTSGNAATATKLATARTISLTGDVTGSGTFDGSGNLSITATVADNSHNHSYLPLAGGTMTGVINKAGSSSSWINGRDKALVRLSSYNAYSAITAMKTTNGSWDMGVYTNDYMYFTYTPDTQYSAGDNSGYVQVKIAPNGTLTAPAVYGAVWNDYAEFRSQKEKIKPGYCVASADDGQVYKTTEKFQACDGIVSDTFGFAIGETDNCKTPLAVAGRVLAYCEGDRYSYHSGDTVCAGPDGKVVKMTREEIREWPDRIIGIVSEIPEYETWGTGNVAVDGRIWIKVK